MTGGTKGKGRSSQGTPPEAAASAGATAAQSPEAAKHAAEVVLVHWHATPHSAHSAPAPAHTAHVEAHAPAAPAAEAAPEQLLKYALRLLLAELLAPRGPSSEPCWPRPHFLPFPP